MQRPIEKPLGTPAHEIDTPALLVDLSTLDANIATVGEGVRAEVWVHKTPAIARRQTARSGVLGIAVRSIAEAEVFAAAGFDDIRVLRPLVTSVSRERAAALAKSIRLTLADDHIPLSGANALDDAVTVSARVTSVPEAGRAILDCGQKAIGRDFGDPRLVGSTDFRASAGSAEHGVVGYPNDQRPFEIGAWVQLKPADVATAFALHDFVYAVRDGRLEAVWPATARGAF